MDLKNEKCFLYLNKSLKPLQYLQNILKHLDKTCSNPL
jgi:hypothetical protein